MDDFGQPMQDKVVLIVWCSVIVLAAVKYCYESRRADVPPLGRTPPEERKVADREAQKELLDKLHESMIVSSSFEAVEEVCSKKVDMCGF